MAKIHGRRGRAYVGIASDTATAEPIVNLTDWTINSTTDKSDVTSLGDGNKNYVSGLPDAQGTMNGFYDTVSPQLYTASQDGLARKFYLYPDITVPTRYFFGTGLFDFSVNVSVSDAVKITSSWAAASLVQEVG